MARVAFVETYPYAAAWGGDAVYLDRIRGFLTARGHSVDSYVTDVTRGRSNPFIRLRGQAGPNHRWIVRNSIVRGDQRFLALEPRLLRKAVKLGPGSSADRKHAVHKDEARWVIARLSANPPDLVILAFDACQFTAPLLALGIPVIALKGFFSDRRIRLGAPDTSQPSPDKSLLDDLRQASCAGFNNVQDLRYYEQMTGARNGALIGMGFPSRPRAPARSEPVVLFVGARTKPNIESLRWFLDHAWPAVRLAAPEARLRIVGTVAGAVAEMASEHVETVGFAEDLETEYRGARAVIAPLTVGSSGVKTKVAEALSFGCPVVTTSLGVDPGDPMQFGEAVEVADEPAAYAAAVVRLLTDDALRTRREEQTLIAFRQHFSEEAAYAALIALLGSIPPAGHRTRSSGRTRMKTSAAVARG